MKRIHIALLVFCALLLAVPMHAQNLPQGPERPELMGLKPMQTADDETDRFMEKTAWWLVFKKPAEVKEFAAKLSARAKWDRQILNEMIDGSRPEDEDFAQQLIDECNNFVSFMLKLGIIAERHTNVRMQRNAQGQWAYSLEPVPQFETGTWQDYVPEAKKKPERILPYAACWYKDKYCFCDRPFGGGLTPVVLNEDEMYLANVSFVLIRNIGIMHESGPMEILKEWYPNDKDRFERSYQTCLLYLDSVSKAIENNDKAEVKMELQPMPKAGAMNASMKAKVLPLEKAITNQVVDCVVTSDNWSIEKDSAGNIVRRVIYGYSIVKTEKGKQATRVSWAEEYMGGGKYGEVHSYGVGGGQFYVK